MFTGCAEVLTAVTEPVRNMRITVNNTLPGPLGYIGTAATKVSVFNPQPFYAKLFANDKEEPVCVIPPGGSVYDQWYLNFNQSVLSLVAIMYRDAACTQWVGVSMTILHLSKGGSYEWTINDVHYPDNSYRYNYGYGVPTYPLSQAGGSQRVAFPDLYLVGMNLLVIPNCTYYTVVVRINGVIRAYIKPGGFYLMKSVLMYHGADVNIQLMFADDRGLFYGYKDLYNVGLTTNGPFAWQYMATIQDANRSY